MNRHRITQRTVPGPVEGPMLIVGGGAAAVAAAQALRDFDFAGPIRVLSAEPVFPYERPCLSKSFLLRAPRNDCGTLAQHDDPPALCAMQTLAERGIELELGARVVSLNRADRTVTTADGRQVGYWRLLLATGARCRRLGLTGEDLNGVHHLREVAVARAVRAALRPGRQIVIVGGGVIGLEIAAAAVQRGCDVTVVEAADRVMGRVVPPEIGAEVAALHQARGVAFLTGVRPVAFTGKQCHATGVELANGRIIPADAVVVGVGAAPNTRLAEEAGLDVNDGILVDERFRTSDPDIFAAGDAVRVPHVGAQRLIRTESWRPAQEQGRLAAAAMLGAGDPYRETPWMWSDQYDASIQATGFGFDEAELIACGGIRERTGLLCFAVRNTRFVGAYGISHGAGVGKAILVAQLLIQRRCHIDVDQLRANSKDVRSLIRQLAALTRGPRYLVTA